MRRERGPACVCVCVCESVCVCLCVCVCVSLASPSPTRFLIQKLSPPGGQGIRATGGGQSCWWWSQGCSIGCERCATELIGPEGSAGGNPPHADKIGFRKRFCNASYNSAGAPVPMINSTLPYAPPRSLRHLHTWLVRADAATSWMRRSRAAWTMNVDAVEGAEEDSYRFNPWRAPGHAPVVDAWCVHTHPGPPACACQSPRPLAQMSAS